MSTIVDLEGNMLLNGIFGALGTWRKILGNFTSSE
jgi:hypothetical protein